MRHQKHLREEAVYLRAAQGLSLSDLAARLGISRTTIYYCVKDVPVRTSQLSPERTERQIVAQKSSHSAASAATKAKYAVYRQEAYEAALRPASEMLQDKEVRDFVVLYLAEGYRKNRNVVEVGNSNPCIVRLAHNCMRRLSSNPHFVYSFQYHADQDPEQLKLFWADYLSIDPLQIKAIPKTNSGQLKGRNFACQYGIFRVQVGDTLFRSRLQALMDVVQAEWATHA